MGDKDPKNIQKLQEQAEEEREEAIEYKHKSPAEKEEDRAHEEAVEDLEPTEG